MSQEAVEVIVMWGQCVLGVEHCGAGRSFVVGDASHGGATDFVVDDGVLGGDALTLVSWEDGTPRLCVLDAMDGCIELGGSVRTLAELRQGHALVDRHCMLTPDTRAELRLGELCFVVRRTAMEQTALPHARVDWRSYTWVGASLAFHAFFLVAFYFLPPSAMARNFDQLNVDSRFVDYVITKNVEEDFVEPSTDHSADASGTDGRAHDGDSGAMGDPAERPTNKRTGTQGNARPEDRTLARDVAQTVATQGGLISLLRAAANDMNTPTSIYGAERAIGGDPMSAMGALLGNEIGANFGFGGLGPIGTGIGGGGDGRGTIGVGEMGTIGNTRGPGGAGGYGTGVAGMRGREARVPTITPLPAEVRGGLSKEAIRREIRRHLAEVRHCYEQALMSRPDLEGRVAVKFIINGDGVVQMSNVAQSTLGHAAAERCIQDAVTRWTFPAGGGVSIVSYPFNLSRAAD